MTISAVGSPWYSNSSASLAVNPTAVGDVLVLALSSGNLPNLTGVSGGGVTTWTAIENPGNTGCALYLGIVTTTGPATITVTLSSGTMTGMRAEQFHSTLGTNWRVIASATQTYGSGSGVSSGNYPSVTATAANQLYVAAIQSSGGTTSGSTSGYTYDSDWDTIGWDSFVYYLNATNPNAYAPAFAITGGDIFVGIAGIITADSYGVTGPLAAMVKMGLTPSMTDYETGNILATVKEAISTSGGFAPADIVPWMLPVSINDHAYQMDFLKSAITTMQVRRQSADDSVEPGEQTLSAAGVWPRAQDNWFLGAGQEFLDNRFAFESVYVHSGEYPSVRTRFWKSQGVNPWNEGKLTLLPEYASIATSNANLLIVVCGNYLYKTDGTELYWTLAPVGIASPSWTQVTMANTHNIVSLTSDGSRVWAACGRDGVYVTVAGTTSSAAAATPAALNNVQGFLAYAAGAGTVNATNLPNGSTTWYVTKVDAFGNETAATSVTATVASTPMNLNWQPDDLASAFNVYRGTGLLIYNGTDPSFVDDGSVAGVSQTRPTSNGTGSTSYHATFISYNKGHLIASTGADLVEILANGSVSFVFQHENPSFVFTCACECPSAILVGGFAGHVSFVGAIQPDSTTNGATLAPPIWATTLTPGEQINCIQYDAGSILMGTSLGIRSGTKPDSTGVFDVNPVVEDPGNVLCVASWSQYEYFGWSNFDPTENWATRSTLGGIGRADLSQYTTPGVPAYASDVMGASAGLTTQVVVLPGASGTAGVPYFVVNNAGSYTLYGPDGYVVPSGWLEPGWVRYGTLENKIVVEVDFQHLPLPAGASVSYEIVSEDTQTVNDVGTNAVAGSTTVDDPFSAGLLVGDRFMPVITLSRATNQLSGPTFLSHITKAMVTTKRQDEVLLALVWDDKEYTLGPSQKTWQMDLLAEYAYLKGIEGSGQTVNLTMLSLVKVAYIDQVRMEPVQEVNDLRTWFKGTLNVKLVTLS